MNREFASLPPHFKPCEEVLSEEGWQEILPDYRTFYPESFRQSMSLFAGINGIPSEFVTTKFASEPSFVSAALTNTKHLGSSE